MLKNSQGFIRPTEDIDPGVAATLSAGNQRQADARLDKAARAKKRKQKAANDAKKERRVGWLIDPEVQSWVAEQAARLLCSESQVVEFAIRFLAWDAAEGHVFLEAYTQPQANPKYKNRLVYPEPEDPTNS
jgi:hypothetical protein